MAHFLSIFLTRQLPSLIVRERGTSVLSASSITTRRSRYCTGSQPYVYEDITVRLVKNYSQEDGSIAIRPFLKDLFKTGLKIDDPRVKPFVKKLQDFLENGTNALDKTTFIDIIHQNGALVEKALKGKFIIQDFESFAQTIDELHQECADVTGGENATYIPELARIDPSLWGVSLCTVSGQRHHVGNYDSPFTIQSAGKCFNYSIALDEIGVDKLHEYVGMEPSGAHFNKMVLNAQGKPHNPMINSGALILCSLLKPNLSLHERVDFMLEKFCELAGEQKRSIKCDMITCDSEMENADRNYALLHYMKSKMNHPCKNALDDTIKLYTRLCSIEVNCMIGAVLAATLANGGICPLTGKKVLTPESVRHSLTLMHSCGMYDYSGEFAFNVGLPSKSGVSGAIVVVVPGVMGLCLYSPPINKSGNSVRGLHFCKRFVETFNFHIYDSTLVTSKKDPRKYKGAHKELQMTSLMYGAYTGAVSSMQRYMLSGIDVDQCNYDKRTPLHIASTNGHLNVVKFLLETANVSINPVDIWSNTPLDNAIRFDHHEVAEYLKTKGGKCNNS